MFQSSFWRFLIIMFAFALLAGCGRETRKARLQERAERDFKSGNYDKARIEYLNLLQLGGNATAFEQLGTIWLEDGAPLRAVPFLLKARELDPNRIENRVRLARALVALGDLAGAQKELTAILEKSPSNGEALMLFLETVRTQEEIAAAAEQLRRFPQRDDVRFHLASASLALRKGDAASAETELRAALASDPKYPTAHLGMAFFYSFKKNATQAGEEFKTAAELAPPRSIERQKYGEFLIQSGQVEEARKMLEETTRQTPDYLPAWQLLARVAFNEKKYDDVLKLLENIFGRDSDNLDARILQAETRLAKGETGKAVADMERLDKVYTGIPLIKYELGRAYVRNGNLAQAVGVLEQAVTASPNFFEAALLLSELQLRAGNALPVVTKMTELLNKRPDLVPAKLLLAEAYRGLRQFDDAAAIYREQIKASPQDGQFYFLLGVILRQQKKIDEARQVFTKSVELAPENIAPVDQLVEIDIGEQKFDAAMEKVQQQLQKNPNSAAAHFMQGKIYAAQRNWDAAESALRKSIELDPNFSGAYDLLVAAYVASNKLPEAIGQLKAVLAKSPDNPGALMMLGMTYEKMKDFPNARDAYEKLLSKKSDLFPALNNLAYLYAEQFNQLDKAFDLAQKARTLQPNDLAAADTLGWILYKRGDYQQAFTLLQETAGKRSDSPEIQFHLGMAAYMMGQTETARSAFQHAVSSSADFAGREESKRRLALLQNDASVIPSLPELEKLSKAQPDDPLVQMRLGEVYEKKDAFQKAAAAYEAALKQNPKLVTATVKLAKLYAGPLQNREKALDFAKKARELAPADPQTTALVGSIAYQAGNFNWAYSLLQESARQLPNDAKVLQDFAWAAYSLGRVGEAKRTMAQVLKAASESSQSKDAKAFLAMVERLDRNFKDLATAEPEVQQLLKADPNYVPALMVQAARQAQGGQSKEAIQIYNDVLRRFPDFAPAQKELAALYAADPGTIPQAYDLAMKARQVLSEDPELTEILGEISYQKKEYARAVQLLQDSARTRPLDAKGLFYLGMSQMEGGQEVLARETLARALAAGLQDPLAQKAKKRLAEQQSK